MKSAQILKNSSYSSGSEIDKCLSLINSLSRRPLSKDEVYIFSMILCDNEVDRDFERFSDESLINLKSLFFGKTGIFDHIPTGSNQTSRIFFTDVITDPSKQTSLGYPYKYLLAKAYMVKSEKNKDLILDIDAGIKKEISIGCSIKSKICSICGANHKFSPCSHSPGQYYNDNGQKQLCFLNLEDPLDAYEWSFVAVPAQINAGIIKNFNNSPRLDSNIISSTNPFEIAKSLSSLSESKKPCFISPASLKSLSNYLTTLENESLILKDFQDELKNQVYKMLSISQPLLSQSSINSIINNLSNKELQSLKSNLSSELETKSPLQLTPLSSNDTSFNSDDNKMFKF